MGNIARRSESSGELRKPGAAPKILCLQHSSLFSGYGGVEYYLNDLLTMAVELYGAGHVKSLIPVRGERRNEPLPTYGVDLVSYSHSGWLRKWENRYSPSYYRAATRIISDFNPTQLLNAHVSLGPMVYALAKRFGLPYTTIVYGIDCWGNLWPQDEFALRHADKILSISQWTKQVLCERGYDEHKIEVVHPIINPVYETNALQERRPGKPFTLLSVSRLDISERYKGQDHVLLALAKIRTRWPNSPLKYLIQGSGDDLPRLKTLAHDLGVADAVEFLDSVRDRNDLAALYQKADAFVMPSRFGFWGGRWRGEGFGIVYAEAAAFGLPAIAYRCGGATDIIEDGKTGFLVSPDNIDQLAESIIRLATNEETWQRLRREAFAQSKGRFTRSQVKQELVSAVRTLCE